MIEVEDFKNLVRSSTIYKTNDNDSTPYLIIEDTLMVCPYCGKELKKLPNKQHISCDCTEAQNLKKDYNEKFAQINVLMNDIKRMNKALETSAIIRFKEYYRDVVVPRLNAEYNKKNEDILNIVSLD